MKPLDCRRVCAYAESLRAALCERQGACVWVRMEQSSCGAWSHRWRLSIVAASGRPQVRPVHRRHRLLAGGKARHCPQCALLSDTGHALAAMETGLSSVCGPWRLRPPPRRSALRVPAFRVGFATVLRLASFPHPPNKTGAHGIQGARTFKLGDVFSIQLARNVRRRIGRLV